MKWFKRKKKYSRNEIDEMKSILINQMYGKYSFGDRLLEDHKECLFVCIEKGYAILYDEDLKKIQYISVCEEKLLNKLDEGKLKLAYE